MQRDSPKRRSPAFWNTPNISSYCRVGSGVDPLLREAPLAIHYIPFAVLCVVGKKKVTQGFPAEAHAHLPPLAIVSRCRRTVPTAGRFFGLLCQHLSSTLQTSGVNLNAREVPVIPGGQGHTPPPSVAPNANVCKTKRAPRCTQGNNGDPETSRRLR